MHRVITSSSTRALFLLSLIHTGQAKSTAASTRSSSSQPNKERNFGEWEDPSALSPFRREHQCAPDTWEAALFGKVSGSCSSKRVKSLNATGGNRPLTSRLSASTTARVEEAERQLRRETKGVERGVRAVQLAAGIRGGSRPGGASRRDGAGSTGGRGKRGRVQAPQQRTRDGGGRRRGDYDWDDEEEYDEDEDLYDYDDEDQEEDYESDAEYYKDERDETDEESDEYDLDFRGDFGDYDEEEDYGNYDAYDGDDYDDHLGYGIEVRPRRAASAGRKSPGRSSPRHRGGEVVRGRGTIKGRKGTQGRGSRGGRGRRVAPSAGASVRMQQLKDRLGDAQEELKTKMSSVKQKGAQVIRELKGSISSDLEKTLIKATRPDDDPAKRKHVNLLLQAAEHAFPAYMDPQDKSLAFWREGPYWMTLHKLWRRMAERDYRTASKAVYVLHRVARGTTAESWGYFRDTMLQMRRVEDKGTKSRYFSRRVIRNVDEEGHAFAEWLDSYAEFVLLRLQSLSPDLSELAAIGSETIHEEASSRSLEKVERLIETALACELGPHQDNDVTCDCLKLVVEDLCELWSLFQEKLQIRLQQRSAGEVLSSSELRRTAEFLEFYMDQLSRAKGLVRDSHRLLALYSHAVPRGLGDVLAEDMLQEQLGSIQEELTKKDKGKDKADTKGKVGTRKSVAADGDSIGAGKTRSSSPLTAAVKVRKAGAAKQRTGDATLPTTKTSAPSPAPAASNSAVSPKKRANEPSVGSSSSSSNKRFSTKNPPTGAVPPTPAKKMKADAATADSDGSARATKSKGKPVKGEGGIVGGEGNQGLMSPASTKASSAPVTGSGSSLEAKKVKKKSSSLSTAKSGGTDGEAGNTAPPS